MCAAKGDAEHRRQNVHELPERINPSLCSKENEAACKNCKKCCSNDYRVKSWLKAAVTFQTAWRDQYDCNSYHETHFNHYACQMKLCQLLSGPTHTFINFLVCGARSLNARLLQIGTVTPPSLVLGGVLACILAAINPAYLPKRTLRRLFFLAFAI